MVAVRSPTNPFSDKPLAHTPHTEQRLLSSGLDWHNQAHDASELSKPPVPSVSPHRSLHANQARRRTRFQRDQLRTPHRALPQNPPAFIYPVHRECMVCQINPYRSNLIQDFPDSKRVIARFESGKFLSFVEFQTEESS